MDGVIAIYKEKGYTSHDVVARLRGILGQRRIGHTGTLDPDVEGVLVLCLGKATKLVELLTDRGKTYRAELLLGRATDTEDIAGTTIKNCSIEGIDENMLRTAIKSFEGSYMQLPPMYSALKVNGKRLYQLAREGKDVERAARKVEIYELDIEEISLPYARFKLSCSKGTYVRSLCRDVGERLGSCACMSSLLRLEAAGFSIEDSLKLDEVEALGKDELGKYIKSCESFFSEYDSVSIASEYSRYLENGNIIAREYSREKRKYKYNCYVKMYDEKNNFVAVYEYIVSKDAYKPYKIFV